MSLVLDCSATLAWVYGDETTEAVRAVFKAVGSGGAWVPAMWRLEVANVLEMGVRRSRHDAGFFGTPRWPTWLSWRYGSTLRPISTPGARRRGWRPVTA